MEVVMDVLIPYVTAKLIDYGINASNMGNVYLYGGIMLGMAFLSLFFGIKALLPEKEVEETTTPPTPVYTPEPKQEKPEAAKPAGKEDIDADLELEKWKRENKQPAERPANRQPSQEKKAKTEQPKTQEPKPAETEKPKQESSESAGANPILF